MKYFSGFMVHSPRLCSFRALRCFWNKTKTLHEKFSNITHNVKHKMLRNCDYALSIIEQTCIKSYAKKLIDAIKNYE